MNRKQKKNHFSTMLLLVITMLSACEEATLEYEAIMKPNGDIAKYSELSAGTSTIFLTSSKAYDLPAPWVANSLSIRFNNGDILYDNPFTEESGLGPVYAGYSCGSCHKNAGRTPSTIYSQYGSGNYGFSSMLVYIVRKNGGFFRDYGRVL
jgi:CxxC motif-containing protein (DUF1111 family)